MAAPLGPMKTSPAWRVRSAKAAFSLRYPYPGCIACDPVAMAVWMMVSMSRNGFFGLLLMLPMHTDSSASATCCEAESLKILSVRHMARLSVDFHTHSWT